MGPSSLFFQPSPVSRQALVTIFGVCFFVLVNYKLLEDRDPAGLVLQGPAPDSRGLNKDLLYERLYRYYMLTENSLFCQAHHTVRSFVVS